MRTKALLCAAALAAGAVAATAQSNVYSLNVVGYVNVPVQSGKYYMIQNPLNSLAATGNVVTNVLQVDDTWDQTILYTFDGNGLNAAEAFYAGYGWYPGATTVNPGTGFLLYATTNGVVSFVGQVQTTNSSTLAPGQTLVGCVFPQGLTLGGMALPAQDQDTVYRYSTTQNTLIPITYYGGYGWYDGSTSDGGSTNGPALGVGEGFYYYNANANSQGAETWTQSFSIQ